MVDAVDSKSTDGDIVGVRVPPPPGTNARIWIAGAEGAASQGMRLWPSGRWQRTVNPFEVTHIAGSNPAGRANP